MKNKLPPEAPSYGQLLDEIERLQMLKATCECENQQLREFLERGGIDSSSVLSGQDDGVWRDENERLHEENKELIAKGAAVLGQSMRYRAALERIATKPPVNEEYGNQGYDADEMQAMADAALQEGE